MPEKPTIKKKPNQPLVIVKSIKNLQKENNQPLTDSLLQFEESELGANFKQLFKPNKVPFKYHTLKYLQKILMCKEVENDIREFRIKESRVRHCWQYEKRMVKDIRRTKCLKDNRVLLLSVKR